MQSYIKIMKTKSNKIKDVEDYIYSELKNKYSQNEIKALVSILFKEYADINSAHLLAFKDDFINESSLLNIVLATQRLKKHEPIQYILGHTEFCGLDIKVTPDVLIPRPETEELIQMIIDDSLENCASNSKLSTLNSKPAINIIDLCTGSGCIALALNKYIANSNVFGIDISQDALKIARENNGNLHLNVQFAQMDILKCEINKIFSEISKFFCDISNKVCNNTLQTSKEDTPLIDIIVSNPPYVMEKEKVMMEKNVLDYEPSLALFVKDENPLVFYEKIAFFAQKYLKIGGKIYLEINNSLANETLALFSQKEYFAQIRKDIFGRERFIFLQKKA